MSQSPTPPRGLADYLLRASYESDAPWSSRLLVERLEARIRDLEAELADPDAALERVVDGQPPEAVFGALVEKNGRARVEKAYAKSVKRGVGAAGTPVEAHRLVFLCVELCRAAVGDTIKGAAERIDRAGGLPQIRDRVRPADRRCVFEKAEHIRAAYYRAERVINGDPDWRAYCIGEVRASVERFRGSGELFDKWFSVFLKAGRVRFGATGMF